MQVSISTSWRICLGEARRHIPDGYDEANSSGKGNLSLVVVIKSNECAAR
jgi:hypothetical protein